MNKEKLIIFIISHGRPNDVITCETLKKCGNTYPIKIIVDNEDDSVDQYRKNFGDDSIIVFDKMAYFEQVDSYDNFDNRRTTTHARNACFDVADDLGYKYFLVLDDDYTSFKLRIGPGLKHPDSCPNLKSHFDYRLYVKYRKFWDNRK